MPGDFFSQRAEIERILARIRAGAEEAAALIDAEGKRSPRGRIAQPRPQPLRPVVELVVRPARGSDRHSRDRGGPEISPDRLVSCSPLIPQDSEGGVDRRAAAAAGN